MFIVMQSSLIEYSFRVKDLFEDLQDGIRLCRAIQLLQHDSSILLVRLILIDINFSSNLTFSLSIFFLAIENFDNPFWHFLFYGQKLVVPSDTHKKSLSNCGIALQYLKQAGVPLSDEDGMLITDADIVNREKELVLSLLWNMFVHLQVCFSPFIWGQIVYVKERPVF